ncbi:MAG: energy-coupling factor ABC transporter ATP-binding protein [Euryarchaeota archaeon]|nr:energy-coupling factor ABC transporter ATP-binding protein [Euryarchaeota archaeon]
MIELNNVSFTYALTGSVALKNVSLQIYPGEFVLVLGDSGSGKSTLLRCINGLIPHFYGGKFEGTVKINERSTATMSPKDAARVVGSVFQDPENQILMQRVENELAFPLENEGICRDKITLRMEEVAALTGIEQLLKRKTSTLSGGEKQKVAIATALMRGPEYLILDEPTSQLDPNAAESLLGVLERINDELGTGIVLVEHRLERTMHRADKVVLMHQGRIIAEGEPGLIAAEYDLDALGVGYPQITRAAKALGLPYLPLTVKEGKKYMSHVQAVPHKYRVSERIVLQGMNLKFSYSSVPVLKNVSLEIRDGEILGLVGNNSTGKSTLAKLLAGLLTPQKGKVTVMGKNVHRISDSERVRYIAMVFQNPRMHLFQDTIYEDIAMGGMEPESIMKRLKIWELRERSAEDLSGGERMLAAIATVAVKKPRVLILDEPTRGLSWRYRNILSEFLKEYTHHGSVLLISHDMETLARNCHRIAMLARGEIVRVAETHEFMSSALLYTTQINKVIRNAVIEEELMQK